ncbi:MAG: WD40 repeat domain-containing protein [Candidatus Fervidibacter sp.]|uniref:WD40 repeat domain-containing protein n=1 Tax=Candidatus Fervidibacter sp. TaxID=3100871 RepID=UPI0040496791
MTRKFEVFAVLFSLSAYLTCWQLVSAPIPEPKVIPPEKEKPVPKAPIIAPPSPQLEEGIPIGEFFAIAFRPDGKFLAVSARRSARFGVHEQRTVDIIDAATGKLVSYYLPNSFYEGIQLALAFSPDGRFLAVGGLDSRVYLWDTKKASILRVLNFMSPPGPVETVAFSPDGKYLAIGGRDGRLKIYRRTGEDWSQLALTFNRQIVKGELVEPTPKLPKKGILSPKGREQLTALLDALRLKKPPFVKSVVFDPKGRWVAVAGTGDVVGIKEGILVLPFPPKTNSKPLAILQGHSKDVTWGLRVRGELKPPVPWVNDLAVSKDGRYLASAGWDGTVRIWDMTTFKQIRKLESPKTSTGRIATRIYNACSISPDNRYVAAGGFGNRVDVWSLATGKLVTSLMTDNIVEAVAFSPKGNILVTGGWDGFVKAWQVGSWRLLWQYTHTFIEQREIPKPVSLK